MLRLDFGSLHRFGIRQASQMMNEMGCLFIDRCVLFVGADRIDSLGSMGKSPMLLSVTSMARISSVDASIPRCTLRHWRR